MANVENACAHRKNGAVKLMRAAAAFIVAQLDNDLIRLTVIKNDVTPGQGSNLADI